ncbi:MAG: hypothetical protein KDE53_19680 [Caldilineaceae bacterium]|nr:hypothetical protein [Caldilineaceae bacterium]
MFDLPFGTNEAIAGLRRPTFAIAIQSGGDGSGGLGGLAGAVGDLLGGGAADPWAEALVRIVVDVGVAPTVDVATLWLANEARAPKVAVGDSGTIELGYAYAGNELVFTGQVDTVRYHLAGATEITLVNGSAQLARRRIEQSYQEQTAGAIVQDLAGQATVATATVEDGGKFPFYAIDAGRTLYQQIARLAQRNGYLAHINEEDALVFAPANGEEAEHTFRFGVDIVALQMQEPAPLINSAVATGEGAAGSNGAEAWSWLVKDPSSNQKMAGSGEPIAAFADPSLRSGDLAESAGQALLSAQTPQQGELLVPGAPAVRVGAAIEIVDAPQEVLNGIFVVYRVRHHFDKQAGFTTRIACRKAGDAAGGGLLGALGGL